MAASAGALTPTQGAYAGVCPNATTSSACPTSGSCGCGGGGPTPQAGDADFGVFTAGTPLSVGTDLTSSQLTALGVDTTTVSAYAGGSQPAWDAGTYYAGANQAADELAGSSADVSAAVSAGAQPLATAPDPRYEVLWHWDESRGKLVNYRRGYYDDATKRGFGDEKIMRKHNLNYKTTFTVTRYPQPGSPSPQGGTSFEYRTPVSHVKCSGWLIFRRCRVVETRELLASVDFRLVSGGPFGVVTSFVEGYEKAPDWVKNALNAG